MPERLIKKESSLEIVASSEAAEKDVDGPTISNWHDAFQPIRQEKSQTADESGAQREERPNHA